MTTKIDFAQRNDGNVEVTFLVDGNNMPLNLEIWVNGEHNDDLSSSVRYDAGANHKVTVPISSETVIEGKITAAGGPAILVGGVYDKKSKTFYPLN